MLSAARPRAAHSPAAAPPAATPAAAPAAAPAAIRGSVGQILVPSGLSEDEARFIALGISKNVRMDGRSRQDLRPLDVSVGVVPSASGSARLSLGNTDVLATVKCELGSPEHAAPNRGLLVVSVDCASHSSANQEERRGRDDTVVLTASLEKMLRDSSAIDLDALCVIPGKAVWTVNLDVAVMLDDGNLLDAITLASRCALMTAEIPRVHAVQSDREDELEIEVSGDPFDCTHFPPASIPLSLTLAKVGSAFVVDPSLEERACASVLLSVSINSSDEVCGVQKFGMGGISVAVLRNMVRAARAAAASSLRTLDAAVAEAAVNAGIAYSRQVQQ